ncbi:MAG: aminopeptidase P family protein [Pyrobaculum sp.]
MIIVTTTANFAYFTGVWIETYERFKAFVKCGDYAAVVVPALDAERLAGRVYSYKDGEDPAEALKAAAAPCGDEEVLVDGGTTLKHFEVLKRAFPKARFGFADDLLKKLRAVKRADEVEKIKTAASLIKEVINSLVLDVGVTERQVAARIYLELSERGLAPGPVLVQFGVNTALPHQEPTKKRLQRGEAVVIDVSAAYGGYFADLTKSLFFGETAPLYADVYQIVEEAQRAAISAARPGAAAKEVDRAARSVIEKAGYGPFFIHRTGHGLGLEVHEAPDISPASDDVLNPGMVFTIEPGVYIPGKFGVRLEVDVHLGDSGPEVL